MQSTIVVLLYFCVAVVGGGDLNGWSIKLKLLNSFYPVEERGFKVRLAALCQEDRGSSVRWIRFI